MDNPVTHLNTYELRHLVVHLEASGRSDDIHALLRLQWEQAEEVPFLQLGSKTLRRNAWYAAKERSGDTDGYLNDLEDARRLADSVAAHRSVKRPEAVALQCLYALIAAVMRDLARNHLPSLAVRYVQAGIWTRDQALTWARLNPDQQLGLKIVQDALHEDKGEGRDELGRLALSTAATIPDSDNRVLAVAGFSGDLPTHLMHAAFEIVVNEPNEGSRLGGLKQIVRKLPKDMLLEALEIAKRFEKPELKAEAIAIVAEALDEPERTEAFHQGVRPLDAFAHLEPDKANREPEKADDAHLVTAEQCCSRVRRA